MCGVANNNTELDDQQLMRRRVAKALVAGTAATILPTLNADAGRGRDGNLGRSELRPNREFEHGNSLREFSHAQVRLAPSLHRAQLEQTHEIVVNLDENALLRPFRLAAGLPAPGNDLGGWYSAPATFGPENFGHWMSALSRFYAATGDQKTRATVERWLTLFSESMDPAGSIFKEFRQTSSCIYNKLCCGLEDAYHHAGLPAALNVLEKMTSAALPYLPGRAVDQTEQGTGLLDESYIVPEYQFIAWQWGAEERHLKMAIDYIHHEYFDSLARGKNVLANRHAYSHVNALCSAAKAYLVLGDEKYLNAARNGLAFVEQQSFVTGGWGPGERFLPKPEYNLPNYQRPAMETLSDSLRFEKDHFETPCGAHAHFKLTRYLLRITKDSKYGDSMERVMYNTVLGAKPLNRFGKAFYQSNYRHHARKEYFDGYGGLGEDEWPCCAGTLPQVAADYGISTYLWDDGGVYVNLYIPSVLRWHQGGGDVMLTQSSEYPLSENIAVTIETSRPVTFDIRLRVPAWARQSSIRVNGRPSEFAAKPGTFAVVRRKWHSGDRIDLQLPRALELRAVDGKKPDTVALVSGSLVLFAVSDDTPVVTRSQLLAAEQQGSSPEWRVNTAKGPVRFVPFWRIEDETYFTYLEV